MVLNVAQILSGATTADPERIALRSGDLVMTVEVLNNLAKQCARLFSGEGMVPVSMEFLKRRQLARE